MDNSNHRDLLRKFPLQNKYGSAYPDTMIPKFEMPEFRLQQLPPTSEMFDPWFKFVDDSIALWKTYKQNGEEFDKWYQTKYLSTKPPGLTTGQSMLLSPAKKGGSLR